MPCKIHKVRFYNPKPLAINSSAFNSSEKWLAVSREDASIEIWDMKHSPFLLKWIAGLENGSVEALCWVDRRLMSTGLGGALVEWDLERLTSKWSVPLTGYAAWCLDVNSAGTMVAVGTEQGYLNLFRVEPEQCVYEKLFDKQEGRIICCKFDKTGLLLVTGSVGSIRIWEVSSGQALHRLNASRHGKDHLVWSVAVLSDMTIVAGDSSGRLTFWDGNLAEQIESHVTHKADVLALVVSEDETRLFCSGVDPTIISFKKVEVQSKRDGTSKNQWVRAVQRHVHEHDVRALVLEDQTLMSLGADGYVALSSYPPKWLMRLPPLPPAPRVAAATATTTTTDPTVKHHLLLLRYSNHLEVWKLGRHSTDSAGEHVLSDNDKDINQNTPTRNTKLEEDSTSTELILQKLQEHNGTNTLKLEEKPAKLVSIRAKGNRQIKCCNMSPDGQYIVYSTDVTVRLFHLEMGEDEGRDGEEEEGEGGACLVRVPLSPAELAACSRAVFTRDSRTLLLHTPGTLTAFHLNTGATLHQEIPTAPHLKGGSILHLETSTCRGSQTTYAACADTSGRVAVWSRAGRSAKFAHLLTLPTYSCVPSALALDPVGHNLLLVYVDNNIVEYNLKERRMSEWPARRMPKEWSARRSVTAGALYHPLHRHLLLLHDHTALYLMHKDTRSHRESNASEPAPKKRQGDYEKSKLKIFPFKYLAGWAWLEGDEAVAVEVLPDNIISQLPPVLATKRFPTI